MPSRTFGWRSTCTSEAGLRPRSRARQRSSSNALPSRWAPWTWARSRRCTSDSRRVTGLGGITLISRVFPCIRSRCVGRPSADEPGAVDPAPQVCCERTEFGLHLDEGLRVGAGGVNLQPVPDDPRVLAQLFEPAVAERRDLRRVERCKRTAIAVAPVEDRGPRQAALGALEDQQLEDVAVVV